MLETEESMLLQLKALMRIASILDSAGERVLGKGAGAIMYQAGKEEGREQGRKLEPASNFNAALASLLLEGNTICDFDYFEGESASRTKEISVVVFRRCPLNALSRSTGSNLGGFLCQALHGYLAGSIEEMLGKKVDLRTLHSGPRACKIRVEMVK